MAPKGAKAMGQQRKKAAGGKMATPKRGHASKSDREGPEQPEQAVSRRQEKTEHATSPEQAKRAKVDPEAAVSALEALHPDALPDYEKGADHVKFSAFQHLLSENTMKAIDVRSHRPGRASLAPWSLFSAAFEP
ncbi:uncharacterized protein MONBRDRAFT_12661 [Monosiga brevicollis MX1]|uniref:Uncharacterized protein n=1 Tax=Monosiga brevicollis TaxID=81824 RepID=A9VCY2_MONBE|nr:uncharacterized protein MONBRDRAFT_12661 [Monosiga brevicollis MX1]EDQ84582.1 predicted protein [Monosiga brevicollis MX1]|eukprot:XP_001750609.1 hypothetical protein [Monosiga brevicollis MX1]